MFGVWRAERSACVCVPCSSCAFACSVPLRNCRDCSEEDSVPSILYTTAFLAVLRWRNPWPDRPVERLCSSGSLPTGPKEELRLTPSLFLCLFSSLFAVLEALSTSWWSHQLHRQTSDRAHRALASFLSFIHARYYIQHHIFSRLAGAADPRPLSAFFPAAPAHRRPQVRRLAAPIGTWLLLELLHSNP